MPGKIEHQSYPERRKSGKGVAQPKTVILHSNRQAEKQRKSDPHHDAVQDGGDKIDLVIPAAVDERVHDDPEGCAARSRFESCHKDHVQHQIQHCGDADSAEGSIVLAALPFCGYRTVRLLFIRNILRDILQTAIQNCT